MLKKKKRNENRGHVLSKDFGERHRTPFQACVTMLTIWSKGSLKILSKLCRVARTNHIRVMYESYKSYKISYKKKYSGKVSYKVAESCWEHVAVALKFSPFRFRLAFNHYRKTLSNQHSIRGTRMYRVHRRSNDRPRRSPRQFDFEISTENNVRFRSNQAFSNTILFIGKGTAPISEITKTVAVACSICCSDATENRR